MAHTILVADDSKTIRKIVEMALKASPYQIVEASSARATMEAVQRGPDVILLDYFMPDGSGYDICRALKNNPSTRQIPVVMMGGSYKNFDEHVARQAGADEVVTKPFKTAQLLSALETVLARRGSPQPAAQPSYGAPAPVSAAPALVSGPAAPPPNPFSAASGRAGLSSPPGFGAPPPQRPSMTPNPSPASSQPPLPSPTSQIMRPPAQSGSHPRIDPERPAPAPVPTPAAQPAPQQPAFDRAELEGLVRDEVQRFVREELPNMLRNVMGDLLQQKILPRLVKHTEDRVNAMLDEQVTRRVQDQVRVELEHLLREE